MEQPKQTKKQLAEENKHPKLRKQEIRMRILELALNNASAISSADTVIRSAKQFEKYVFGEVAE